MGGIIAASLTAQPFQLRSRIESAQAATAYRGTAHHAQETACLISLQARHDEAFLLEDDHSTLALHGYIAASSLGRLGMASPAAVKQRLNRGDDALLQQLDGEFSLVYFDPKKTTLTFYCSTSATRPLYFHQANNQLIIGTEIRQILRVGDIGRQLNKAAWSQHILFGHQLLDREETLYQGIRRAQGGCIYTYEIQTGRLAQKPFTQALAIDHTITQEAAKAALLSTVDSAVQDALRPQHMGLALSSGLDSGLILALADKHLEKDHATDRLSTYSLAFPGWAMDETAVIEETLRALHRQGTFIDGTQHLPSRYFDKLSKTTDLSPLALTDCYIEALGPVMAAANCHYRLTGFIGDLTLGFGLSYLQEYLRKGRIIKATRDAALFENQQPFSLNTALRRIYRLFRQVIKDPRQQAPAWLHHSQQAVFQAGLDKGNDYVTTFGHSIGPRMLLIDTLRSGAWSDIPEQHSARWGMDLLSPLAYQSLIDFSFTLPHDWLDGGRHNRFMIRAATQHLVPETICAYRPKVVHNDFINRDHALLPFAGLPDEWRLVDEQLVDPAHLNTVLKDCKSSGQIDLQLSTLLRSEHLARQFD